MDGVIGLGEDEPVPDAAPAEAWTTIDPDFKQGRVQQGRPLFGKDDRGLGGQCARVGHQPAAQAAGAAADHLEADLGRMAASDREALARQSGLPEGQGISAGQRQGAVVAPAEREIHRLADQAAARQQRLRRIQFDPHRQRLFDHAEGLP